VEKLVKDLYAEIKRRYPVEDLARAGILSPPLRASVYWRSTYPRELKISEDIHHARLALVLALAGKPFEAHTIISAMDRIISNPIKYSKIIRAIQRLHNSVGRKTLYEALREKDRLNDESLALAARILEENEEEIVNKLQTGSWVRTVRKFIESESRR